jgi:membrane-associated phospholipid phosphatase
MYKLIAFLLSMNVLAATAAPSCLSTGDCFEHDGQIIDLRTNVVKKYETVRKCDPIVEMCTGKSFSTYAMPTFTKQEFHHLVEKNGPEYFIPIDVNSKDFAMLAGALSLGTVVFANDREIMDYVQRNKTPTTESILSFGEHLGGTIGMTSVAAGSYFIGAVMKNGKLKQVGIFTVTAGLATQIVTEAFKKTFKRTRPNETEDPNDFFEGGQSFFSGHASAAFSLATVVAEVYKDKPIVPYIAYGAAALTAFSRVHDNKHWASDVLVGAVAGHLITKILLRTLQNTDRSSSSGLIITPQVGVDEAGNPFHGVQVEWTPGKKKSELKCGKSGLEGRDLIRHCMDEVFQEAN